LKIYQIKAQMEELVPGITIYDSWRSESFEYNQSLLVIVIESNLQPCVNDDLRLANAT
jgi:hypothetical protein